MIIVHMERSHLVRHDERMPSPADMGGDAIVIGVMDARAMWTGEVGARLAQRAEVVVEPGPADRPRLDAVLAYQDTPLTRDVLRGMDRLVVATHLGTAIHVDVDAATDLGIVVLHNPGHNAASVAEHTIGLMLALAKRIPRSDRIVRSRQPWQVGTRDLYGTELAGKTLGLLGFGSIGSIVARIASAGLEMRVVVFEQNVAPVVAAGYPTATLDEVLEQSDVVSVHLPLTPATRHLVGREQFARMKPTALLVHTSRGEVVDYAALYDALVDGAIAGAAFDTWPGHRPNLDSPLIDLENVVMTQHNAGLTDESAQRMAQAVVSGIWDVLEGREPGASRLANPDVWDHRRRYAGHI